MQISFDMSLQSTLLLAFFSTIGLSADVRMLLKGGMRLVILLVGGDRVPAAAERASASLPRSGST